MAGIALQGNNNGSGSLTILGPNTDSAITVNVAAENGTISPLVSGTTQAATGSSVDFTGIPSWVKRITVTLNAVSSTTTAGNMLIRVGSGTVETSGYFGIAFAVSGGTTSTGLQTTGIYAGATGSTAASQMYSTTTLVLHDASTNTWLGSMQGARDDSTDIFHGGHGKISLSGTLNVLSVIPGAGTFDAGTINIMYE